MSFWCMAMKIVVGGGVSGIVSAILLRKRYNNVCIIEKENELGGLYNSISCDLGVSFDHGSHFLRSTGIKELDEIILRGVTPRSWRVLGNLRGGSYYGSQLNKNSPFLDLRCLSRKIYYKGMAELINCTNMNVKYNNLEEQLIGTFGKLLTEQLFRPIISNKYYGCPLNELSVNSHKVLGLSKLLGFSAQATREIKKIPLYDEKLGFHSSSEGNSNLKNYYPIKGGIGNWIDLLKRQMINFNIKIITGANISQVKIEDNKINSILLNDRRQIDCDLVAWTIPTLAFLKAAGISTNSETEAIQSLYTSVYHFVFDKLLITDLHYIQCYQSEFKTFRVTLYPNFQRNGTNLFNLTAEVVSTSPPDLEVLSKIVISELVKIGIVPENLEPLYRFSDIILNGFPLPSIKLDKRNKDYLRQAKKSCDNIHFFGRGIGGYFTTNPILIDVYQRIKNL